MVIQIVPSDKIKLPRVGTDLLVFKTKHPGMVRVGKFDEFAWTVLSKSALSVYTRKGGWEDWLPKE